MRPVALILLAACAPDPRADLGEDAADGVTIADSAPLAHFAAAFASGGPTTVSELLASDEPFAFDSAPNPEPWFTETHDAHQALPVLTGTPTTLRVLSYNVGLLSRRYAIFLKVAVPHIEDRRALAPTFVFDQGYDVLFLQETWELDDLDAFIAAGEAASYTVWGGDGKKFHKEVGTIIAVKSSLIVGDETRKQGQYAAQWGAEHFPGPNLKRGWLESSFELGETGLNVHLFDTHPTPFAAEWPTRNLQLRELGRLVAAEPSDDLVLVGGDLNAGWYYADDVWTNADGDEEPGWWSNGLSPALLAHYGGLQDAKNAAAKNEDVTLGDLVPRGNGAAMLEEPFGEPTFCDQPNTTFTATDCNTLYFDNYAGTEFPARLDHVMFRDGSGRVRVIDQKLVFVDPMDFGEAGSFELSDHYGLEVTLEIGAQP